jgi:YD repeat-containing protein
VSKPASALSKLGTGWFGLSYDDIANGDYEYRLTVKDSAGQLLNLTALGGTAQGLIAGAFTVLRGGQSIVGAPAPQLVKLDPVVNRTVDRWGNVLSLSDPAAAGRITNFRYNHANQMISEIKPETDIWNESGVNQRSDSVANDRPTTRYAYDARGGLVATTDANGKINGIRYDEAGQAVSEIHADGGVARTIYDAFGRKTASIDANGKQTSYSYDRADRLTRVRTPLSEDTSYAYDEAGRQIKVTDALGNSTAYDYDTRGNLVRTRQPLGQTSAAFYDLQNRKITEIQGGTSEFATWRYDYFGRLIDHVDLGGANYDYSYDYNGNLVTQSNNRGQHLVYTYYDNGLIRKIDDWANASQTYYEYDAAGRRTRERYRATSGGATATAQDTRIAYDELGRIASVKDTRYAMSYSYDAVGNRRHAVSNYYDPAGAAKTADYWYLYDGMNRIVLSQGVRNASTGKIEIRAEAGSLAAQGTSLAYDAAGNRRTAVFYEGSKQITETYTYDDDNRLKNTHRGGQLTSSRNYDKNGRVTQYTNFSSPGTISDRRVTTYNANGWITSQLNYDAANTLIARVRYDYANSYDSYGNVTYYTVEGLTGTKYTYSYSKTYKKFDSAREDKINGTMAVYYPNGTTTSTGDTTSSYDANGNLVRVVDRLGTNTTRDFVVNTGGQILKKTEANASEYYFYANGAPVGASGGTAADFDYNYTPVTESYPANSPTNYLVNAGDTLQGIALAVYGDAKLWYLIADANGLTSSNVASYVGKTITIPNRISNVHNDYQTFKPYNPGAIVGDTTPTVPTPPPPPPKDGGCGGAAVIIAIVAVVATVMTAGAAGIALNSAIATSAAGATTIGAAGIGGVWAAGGAILSSAGGFGLALASAAIGGAVGSIAGQLTGMALGVQDKFSWGAVAAGALSSAAMAGMGASWKLNEFAPVNAAINVAARNVVTQGINIVTGQQVGFNWSSLAASAVSASITEGLGKGLDGKSPMDALARAGVGALTSAVANKAIGGVPMSWSSIAADTVSSFMRSDEFGNLLGNAFAADALGNGISLGASRPGLQLNGAGVGYQSVPINDDPEAWQCLAPADGTYTLAGSSRFTAQKGETVWQYAGGDLAKIGAFKRLNGLNDADVIVAGRQYLMPESVSAADVAAGQAQARQWQAKAEAAQQRAASENYGNEGRSVPSAIGGGASLTPMEQLAKINGWKAPTEPSVADGFLDRAVNAVNGYLAKTNLMPYEAYNGDINHDVLAFSANSFNKAPVNLLSATLSVMGDAAQYLRDEWKIPLEMLAPELSVGRLATIGKVKVADSAVAMHPGRLAAESSDISQQSIMRALRDAGTPESLATAKLISRGKVEVKMYPTDPTAKGAGGRYYFGRDSVEIYQDAFATPMQAAGYTTHETVHWMQNLSRSNYHLGHEFDAFRAQSAVDVTHFSRRWTDPQLYDWLGQVYKGVRPAPQGWN